MAIAALLPQTTSDHERIDITLLPPLMFLAGGMDVVVVDGAKRNGELIAHLQTEPLGLRVAYVVRVRGSAPTDEQGWLAPEGRCSLQRMRFGSPKVRTLLSILVRAPSVSVSATVE